MLKALFPQAVFMPKERSIHATVKIQSRTLHSPISALLDSGATDNFITPELVEHFQIPTRTLTRARTICNVDGTKNKIGNVTKNTQLTIRYRNESHLHNFYVADLGNDAVLLGMPFFAATNPEINWKEGTFHGKVIASTTDSHQWIPNQDNHVH